MHHEFFVALNLIVMNFNYINKPLSVIFLSIFINSISYSQHSVKKLNVEYRDIDQALLKIAQLEPKIFDYSIKKKSTANHGLTRQPYGFVPENMMKVFPALVTQTTFDDRIGKNLNRKRNVLAINEAGLIPILVASIHELHSELEKLKIEIAAMKSQ